MQILPTTFTRYGDTFTQLERKGDVAIYHREGNCPCYEVVKIKSHNGFPVPGTDTITPPAEFYPGTNSWGQTGWTYMTKEGAHKKFLELSPKRKVEYKQSTD